MEQQQPETPNSGPHLIAGVMGIAKNMFGLLLNRIELAALELAEVRASLLRLALVFAVGLFAGLFAIGYWSALLVYLAWDTLGWKILFILAAGFTAIAIGVLVYARRVIAEGKLSMPITMNELRNDHDALL
jgi:uncharacterized membrane protein YqjE